MQKTKAELEQELKYRLDTIVRLQNKDRASQDEIRKHIAELNHYKADLEHCDTLLRARQDECQRHIATISALKAALKAVL